MYLYQSVGFEYVITNFALKNNKNDKKSLTFLCDVCFEIFKTSLSLKVHFFIKIISFKWKCICSNQPVMNILSQTLHVKIYMYILQGSLNISILTNAKLKSKVHVKGYYWVFIKILFSNHPSHKKVSKP